MSGRSLAGMGAGRGSPQASPEKKKFEREGKGRSSLT